MHIRTYRARSLEEALQRVQSELGPDARVVHAREVQTAWWDRLARGRQFEVRTRRGASSVPLRRAPDSDRIEDLPSSPNYSTGHEPIRYDQLPPEDRSELDRPTVAETISSEIFPTEFANMVSAPQPQDRSLWERLIAAEIPPAAVKELIALGQSSGNHGVTSDEDKLTMLAQQLELELPLGGAIRLRGGQRRVVALVGPTGVGKTTTLAKLAANWRLREQRQIGLITVDTYRVAAVDQLRTYADIMDLPMEVVTTPREMRSAVARFADYDGVLIDTAGRSPQDAAQLQELKSLLHEAAADEVHLVVSAVTSPSHIRDMVFRFLPVGVTSLLISKLDEATQLGGLLPVIREIRAPVSYLTCGQDVPDDIRPADRRTLIEAMIGRIPVPALIQQAVD